MNKIQISSAAVLALAAATAAWAGGHMKAGQWEMKAQMLIPGMPFTPPPQTNKICVSQADADSDAPPKTFKDDSGCKLSNLKQSASGTTADITCDGKMKGKGSFHGEYPDPTHYTGGFEFTGDFGGQPGMKMQQSFSSTWLKASCN